MTFSLPSPLSLLKLPSVSPRTNTIASRDQFKPIRIGENLVMNYKYGLLTKREVKMTGYWPSSFFACLWTETKSRSINTQKKNEANIQSS